MATHTPLTWSVLVPVKVLALAKSRITDLGGEDREALVLAMASDTVAAALGCAHVGSVVVISDDPAVRDEMRAIGAELIADTPREGLNEALVAGAQYARSHWPGGGLAALTADLPALSSGELEAALSAASSTAHAFVPDAAGTGTTMYTARAGEPFQPLFGPQSALRHREAGVAELGLPGIQGLRRDVDTIADLAGAAALGLGRRTAALRAERLVRKG